MKTFATESLIFIDAGYHPTNLILKDSVKRIVLEKGIIQNTY